jgi:hypothetical protein
VKLVFKLEVEVERIRGKFSSREDLATAIVEEVDGQNPGSITLDNDAEYDITGWFVSEEA